MYERFTDRSRKLMTLANKEAQRLKHEYIGTEHVLLGLIEEGSGVAVNVLKNLDVDLGQLRSEVVRVLVSGPERVVMGKLPQTPRGRKVIEYAMEEARNLKHKYVGTEHILLGLMREQESVAAAALRNQGLELDQVRREILSLLGHGIRATPAPPPARPRIEDVPGALKGTMATLVSGIRRLQDEKEEAIANQEFEKAAALRDEEHKLLQRRGALVRQWLADRIVNPGWLSANDGAVLKLARVIGEQRCWQLLPSLADSLEQAGCTDLELVNHCRQPGEHSDQCWVVKLLLRHA